MCSGYFGEFPIMRIPKKYRENALNEYLDERGGIVSSNNKTSLAKE
jgi:hypothetical protein